MNEPHMPGFAMTLTLTATDDPDWCEFVLRSGDLGIAKGFIHADDGIRLMSGFQRAARPTMVKKTE